MNAVRVGGEGAARARSSAAEGRDGERGVERRSNAETDGDVVMRDANDVVWDGVLKWKR